MSLPTRGPDGVALVTRNKAVCQAVWPAWHLFFPNVDFGSIPAPENVGNHMYCHAFHEFSGSENMEPLEQGQFLRAPAGEFLNENR